MKIALTGASGFIGARLIEGANRLAHRVVAFSRKPKNRVPGSIETRLFSLEKPMNLEGCEAVVHLAGESIFGLWTARKKRRIRESRVLGTRRVVDSIAVAKQKPRVLLCASAIGFYGDTGEEEVDESSPQGRGFLAEVCGEWEAEALRAEQWGVRVVILRLGLVIGKNGGVMSVLRPLFFCGLGGKIGSGRQWMSWVHVSDVAGLTFFALENPNLRGVFNCVSPTPTRNIDFTIALAKKLKRPAFFTLPAGLLRIFAGELSTLLLASQRVVPRRALKEGFSFRYTKL